MKKAVAYCGQFDVIPNDFDLRVERLIIRKNEIAFRIEGTDIEGEFYVEGTAPRFGDGSFRAEDIPVNYAAWKTKSYATLVFASLKPSERGCTVSGSWRFEDVTWALKGRLKKYAG